MFGIDRAVAESTFSANLELKNRGVIVATRRAF